jgi:DNA polymerase III subunit gamma/tau
VTESAAGDLPSRDELTLAWSDSVLPTLSPRAKAFFNAGRFIEVADGAAVFGLPNAPHVEKCENGRPEVEAALAEHFGRPVPLRLVVDADAAPADPPAVGTPSAGDSGRPPRARSEPATAADDDIDLSELTDATGVASSSVERVRELFPGAELVDEG